MKISYIIYSGEQLPLNFGLFLIQSLFLNPSLSFASLVGFLSHSSRIRLSKPISELWQWHQMPSIQIGYKEDM